MRTTLTFTLIESLKHLNAAYQASSVNTPTYTHTHNQTLTQTHRDTQTCKTEITYVMNKHHIYIYIHHYNSVKQYAKLRDVSSGQLKPSTKTSACDNNISRTDNQMHTRIQRRQSDSHVDTQRHTDTQDRNDIHDELA